MQTAFKLFQILPIQDSCAATVGPKIALKLPAGQDQLLPDQTTGFFEIMGHLMGTTPEKLQSRFSAMKLVDSKAHVLEDTPEKQLENGMPVIDLTGMDCPNEALLNKLVILEGIAPDRESTLSKDSGPEGATQRQFISSEEKLLQMRSYIFRSAPESVSPKAMPIQIQTFQAEASQADASTILNEKPAAQPLGSDAVVKSSTLAADWFDPVKNTPKQTTANMAQRGLDGPVDKKMNSLQVAQAAVKNTIATSRLQQAEIDRQSIGETAGGAVHSGTLPKKTLFFSKLTNADTIQSEPRAVFSDTVLPDKPALKHQTETAAQMKANTTTTKNFSTDGEALPNNQVVHKEQSEQHQERAARFNGMDPKSASADKVAASGDASGKDTAGGGKGEGNTTFRDTLVETASGKQQEAAARTSSAEHATRSDVDPASKDFKSEVIRQIVERMTLRGAGRQSQLQIHLKPEFLGNLRLQVITENHQVTVRMTAESTAVKEMIEQHVQVLKNELQQHGLEIHKFDVFVGQQNDAWRQRQHQQAARHPKGGFSTIAEKEEGTKESDGSQETATRRRDRRTDRGEVDFFA